MRRKVSGKTKKWSEQMQAQFLIRCGELLTEGFSLADALNFACFLFPKQQQAITFLREELHAGKNFIDALRTLGYSEDIVTQLELAMASGQFERVMGECGLLIQTKRQQWQKLSQLMVYPALLLSFVLAMILTLRYFFLPQLQLTMTADVLARYPFVGVVLWFIEYFPHVMIACVGIVLVTAVIIQRWLSRWSAVKRARWLIRWPIIGKWYREYYTFFVSREFAQLLRNGLSFHDLVPLIQQHSRQKLLVEVTEHLSAAFTQGVPLADVLTQLHLFNPTFATIVRHGELTSQLAVKLQLFSNACWDRLIGDVNRKMTWIQPLIFLGVALVVMVVYLTLLLPMFTTIEGVI